MLTRKTLLAAFIAAMVSLTGCDKVPSVETVAMTTRAVGTAAGLVLNQTDLDATTRATIIEISETIRKYVPETNTTFEAAWMPIASEEIDKLVESQKITKEVGGLILGGFSASVKTLDWCVNVRWPKIRMYNELVEAATTGFFDGFLGVFRNFTAAKTMTDFNYDLEAYNHMKMLMQPAKGVK